MKILSKSKVSTVALVLMLTITATLVALPVTNAQEYVATKTTYAYIGAMPNPVGKGQEVLLHVGITDYLNIVTDGWKDLSVTIEKPDGTTKTIEHIRTDSTGGTGVIYVPDQVGTYYLQTHFPEQTYNWTTPPIFDPELIGVILYKASVSEKLALVVQEEPIEYYPGVPLPSEYWTRPIDAQLREWYTIAGNWLITPVNMFAPYNDGPETAHILWAKPLTTGGLAGGELVEGMEAGDAYEGKWASSVIINGKLFYNRYSMGFGGGMPQQGIVAVDLRTGEELWFKNNTRLSFGQLFYWQSFNYQGVFAYLWEVESVFDWATFTFVNNWYAYDPFTGEWVYTMKNVPSTGEMFGASTMLRGSKGEFYIYTVNLQKGWMTLWNSSRVVNYGLDPMSMGSWRPFGQTYDAARGYEWNKTIPTGLPGTVRAVLQDRIIGSNHTGMESLGDKPITTWGLSLEPGHEGELLFKETWQPPTGDLAMSWAGVSLEDGVFVVSCKETRQWYGFSLEDGKKLWGPTESQAYLDGIGIMRGVIAYGKLFSAGMGGVVYCYDVKTGDRLWTYEVEDPYTEILWSNNWPVFITFITDGKVYLGHSEHSPNQPLPRGAPYICLDATTGDVVWRADGLFRQTMWGGPAIIGDSIIATMDTYDERVYAIGKGPSATTVSIQNDVITQGSSVLIKGMVTDVSPGTKEYALTARFPNGVPAIADEYMSDWMLYVYKQFPAPMDVKGVDVLLQAMSSNGTITEIGWVKSDGSGSFSCMWTPPEEDVYTIMAIFMGSKSYWPSYAQTALGVGAAPPPPPEEPEAPAYTAIDLVIIAAVVVAICLVIYTLYTVRKLRK